jgi:hypothetical protein
LKNWNLEISSKPKLPRPGVTPRRFPPPWSVEETDACFIVRDHNRQALAYVYFEDEPGRRAGPSSSPATRLGASPPTSPCCRSCSPGGQHELEL